MLFPNDFSRWRFSGRKIQNSLGTHACSSPLESQLRKAEAAVLARWFLGFLESPQEGVAKVSGECTDTEGSRRMSIDGTHYQIQA